MNKKKITKKTKKSKVNLLTKQFIQQLDPGKDPKILKERINEIRQDHIDRNIQRSDDLDKKIANDEIQMMTKKHYQKITSDPATSVKLNPTDTTLLGNGIPNYVLDPKSIAKDFSPLATSDQIETLNKFYDDHPQLHQDVIERKQQAILAYHNNQFPKIDDSPQFPKSSLESSVDFTHQQIEDVKKLYQALLASKPYNPELRGGVASPGKTYLPNDKLYSPTTIPLNQVRVSTSGFHKNGDQKGNTYFEGLGIDNGYDSDDHAWIQTYSGRRFSPINPNPNAIVIQDISHALAMQCRFTGHTRKFYSIAQHSVLVSYICDPNDRLFGLMHDASEAFLTDLSSPLKRSGKFQDYVACERKLQQAICIRFGLPLEEPPSVKKADNLLLATEARDLLGPLHSDWKLPVEPLPFTITPWTSDQAEDKFIKRFFELTGCDQGYYQHYLDYKKK